MKKQFLLLLLLAVSYSYSQSVNDYKAVIVPLKYDFLNGENQYRLSTLTKFNLNKVGFVAFYSKETIPGEYSNRCDLLYVDVVKESGFLTTKLYITMKDCNDKIIFQSAVGRSKEKEYQVAYTEALNEAFQSVYDLQYKYSGISTAKVQSAIQPEVVKPATASVTVVKTAVSEPVVGIALLTDSNLLYAQPTATGFQLIDSTPKVIMKLFKTSQPNSFIAIKDTVQGSLILKDNQWYFEYYQNDKLISEKVAVKF
ncbi:hypothetical protein E0I61_08620 [Flavobacterium ranwuense]|uniref:Secreted protein n=1 Tax=Flavobacterium ranwuense TaxID=2541725 RepID=A0ABY2DR34_9FLAO|nr:hypothetical protein [Flavobacterium ranwuense]TDE29220.1 hypothetical protein E0I61_08620 [Flavobacterium ranwuense]